MNRSEAENARQQTSDHPGRRHANILQYWRAIELFSLQQVPRLNSRSKKRQFSNWPVTGRSLGERAFGKDPMGAEEKAEGEGSLFAVQIGGEGRPLLDTFVLASACWATGRLIDPGPHDASWLEGFDSAGKEAAVTFSERFAVLEDDDFGREFKLQARGACGPFHSVK